MTNVPSQIGAYTIEREIGRGGMGVVYLAKDPGLDRHVAIKVLPDVVSRDPERLARFEREARLLASVNHPNIGGIYGIEEADGQRFLVLEYLRGETLAARLKRGPLSPSDAIHVCAQIAAALEVAHEAGVIHRDLKPGNVMLSDDDEVKVLDFGLAKGDATMAESSSDLSVSPTVTVGATAIGVVLGTAAYMSPEQARGKPVDRRTDIWSFGCVLYECLTGKQLFGGETVSDTIAKILERQPDWDALPKDTPDRVRELIRRCLEKKAKERLRDIGDARIELVEVASGKTSSISGVSQAALKQAYKGRIRLAWGAVAVTAAIAIAAVVALMARGPAQSADGPLQFSVQPLPGMQMSARSSDYVISPDGERVAFKAADSLGVQWLWVRELSSLEIRQLPGTREGNDPFWALDSRRVAFFGAGKLRSVAVDGGQPRVLCDAPTSRGGSWGKDYVVFAGGQGPIYKVPVGGGAVETVTVIDTVAGDAGHRFPRFLPDGEHFIYAALPERMGMLPIYVGSVNNDKTVRLMDATGRPEYATPGYLVYRVGTELVAHPFDAGRLELTGSPVPIGPAPSKADAIAANAVSASRTGRLVHLTPEAENTRVIHVDLSGRVLDELDLEPGSYWSATASPDGRYVAYARQTSPEESDIWIYEMDRKVSTRFTFAPGRTDQPYWTPDGKRIMFVSDRDGSQNLYVKTVDGGEVERIAHPRSPFTNSLGWSPDGRYALYSQVAPGTGMDLWITPMDGSGEPMPYMATPFAERTLSISPDGKWAAFESMESGAPEIYVASFPVPGRKYRVSDDGGTNASWSADGKALLFGAGDGLAMRAAIQTTPELRAGTPQRIFTLDPSVRGGSVCTHGNCMILILVESAEAARTFTVLAGWQQQLEGK